MATHLDRNRIALCKAHSTPSVLNIKGLIHSKLLHYHFGVVAHWFLQSSLPSLTVPEDSSSSHPQASSTTSRQAATLLLSSMTPDSLAAYELYMGLNSAHFNHGNFTKTAPLGHNIHMNKIQPSIQICTQLHHKSVAPGFSSLLPLQALPTDSASDASATFSNSSSREKTVLFWEWFRGSSVITNSLALILFMTLGTYVTLAVPEEQNDSLCWCLLTQAPPHSHSGDGSRHRRSHTAGVAFNTHHLPAEGLHAACQHQLFLPS